MQCQQTTLDLGAKLAAEKRDRDQDFDQVSLYPPCHVWFIHIYVAKPSTGINLLVSCVFVGSLKKFDILLK